VKKLTLGLCLVACCALSAGAQTIRVVNAASFSGDQDFSPGALIAVFGTNLTNTTASAPAGASLPKTLGGVTLTIAGVSSPLFYVSPTQVNAQIDPSVRPGPATVTLTSSTSTFTASIKISAASGPGIFSMEGSGDGDGAILNAVTFQPGAFTVTTNGKPTYLAIFVTNLDLSTPPVVTIGGIQVPVQYYGPAPGFAGLEQINVQLPAGLDGAGRVEVTVASNGQVSNVVEVVIVPKPGEGSFAPDHEDETRSREISTVAYIPNTSMALVADENDDVLRVVDVGQRQVTQVVALSTGAEPVAIAVNAAGTLAVVAERDRNMVAIVDLTTWTVVTEVPVGMGPVAVAIAGNNALVVNQRSNSVSVVSLAAPAAVTATITGTAPNAIGLAPRGIAVDTGAGKAYVTNQNDGTISVIDLATNTVERVIGLGPNVRPADIQVIPSLDVAVVTEPSAMDGAVEVLNLATGASTSVDVNPARLGGTGALAVAGSTVYFADQTGGSITVAPVSLLSGGAPSVTSTNINVGLGARALAVDVKDNLLLVASECTGQLVLIDLSSNQIAGRIDVLGIGGEDEANDHSDRERAANMPVVLSLSPASAAAGSSFTLAVTGKNLAGATNVVFVDPNQMPGHGNGHGEGDSQYHNNGPFSVYDPGFTTGSIVVSLDGTALTVPVAIAAGHAPGNFVVRVATPNGESTFVAAPANTFSVQ
jgi:uncharacterized protein (TIGR03437 family)